MFAGSREYGVDGLSEVRGAHGQEAGSLNCAFLVYEVSLVQGEERLHHAGRAPEEAADDVEGVASRRWLPAGVEREARLPQLAPDQGLLEAGRGGFRRPFFWPP